jgi:hypothetical protein
MDDMISWAVANGAFVHPLVEYRDGGMFAKADLEKVRTALHGIFPTYNSISQPLPTPHVCRI